MLTERHRQDRPGVLLQTTQGSWGPTMALNMLDTKRWLERVSYHAWRICHYLGGDGAPETTSAAVEMHPSAGASVPT